MNISNRITQGKIKRRIEEMLYDYESTCSKTEHTSDEVIVKEKEESAPAASAQQANAPETKTTLRDFVKRITVLSNIITWLFRLKKIPWRVLHIDEELQLVRSEVATLTRKMDALSLSVETSHVKFAEVLTERIYAVQARIDAVDGRVSSLNDRLNTVGSHVVSLHEKTDNNAILFNLKLDRIKPVINAGDNLLATRVDDFIMGFPAEDIKLAAALSFDTLEPGLRQLLKNMINEGMVVVDVGAHIGLISLIAARKVGKSGKVYCFEPTPRTFQILQNNIAINNLEEYVVLRQMAITDKKGQARLALRQVFGHNTLFPSREDDNFAEIETDSLDNCFMNKPKIDIVKIDAEGAEPFIMRGMKNIIANNPSITIFLEFAPTHLSRAGIHGEDFLAEIRSQGLSFRQVVEPSGTIELISEQELMNSFSVNLILRREFTD